MGRPIVDGWYWCDACLEWQLGSWFIIKTPSYTCWKSHSGDKNDHMYVLSHNGIYSIGKTSLYWIRALVLMSRSLAGMGNNRRLVQVSSPSRPHCHRCPPMMTCWLAVETPLRWCQYIETFSTSLTLCEENPPVIVGFPSQRATNREIWFLHCYQLQQAVEKKKTV